MKDKTIVEIASSKRVQDAFMRQLSATPEQRLKPRQFVIEYLVEHIKGIVKAAEDQETMEIKRKELEAKPIEIII